MVLKVLVEVSFVKTNSEPYLEYKDKTLACDDLYEMLEFCLSAEHYEEIRIERDSFETFKQKTASIRKTSEQ